MHGAGDAGIETMDRALDFERLLGIVKACRSMSAASYVPGWPEASRCCQFAGAWIGSNNWNRSAGLALAVGIGSLDLLRLLGLGEQRLAFGRKAGDQ